MLPSVSPLSGVRVVDLSQGIAGPSAAMYCARWGADVVKVEPLSGDWIRGLGGTIGEFSASALAYNAGKRSLSIDLKHPQSAAVMERLLSRADVVIESFRPGVAARLGVGFEDVKALRSKFIYLSISGFGATGPLATKPCTDTVAQAFSGFMSINRGADGIPHKIDTTVIDALTGLYAYQALSMHLVHRLNGEAVANASNQTENAACHLDISLMECAAAILSPNIIEWSMSKGEPTVLNAPAGTYRTKNGWIAITLVREHHFVALAQALGKPELAEDTRYADFPARAANLTELRALIDEIVIQETTQFWLQRLTEHGVLTSLIHDIGQWLGHEQVVFRNSAPQTRLAAGIDLPMPGLPGLSSSSSDRCVSPAIGQHSREVLVESGFSETEIDALIDNDCIVASA